MVFINLVFDTDKTPKNKTKKPKQQTKRLKLSKADVWQREHSCFVNAKCITLILDYQVFFSKRWIVSTLILNYAVFKTIKMCTMYNIDIQ